MGAEIATVRKKKLGRIQNVKSMKWLVVALACGLAVPAAMGAALLTQGSNEIGISGQLDVSGVAGAEVEMQGKYA